VLPFEGKAKLWGEEIYFPVPFQVQPENSREEVKIGEVGIWLEEPSLCIFFGKTPKSTDYKIFAYSPVNVIAKIEGDPKIFSKVRTGEKIRVSLEK